MSDESDKPLPDVTTSQVVTNGALSDVRKDIGSSKPTPIPDVSTNTPLTEDTKKK